MKKIRLLLLFPVLLAAVALLIGCIDRDGNYEKVDIWMEGIDLHGTLFYTRTKDNARHEIAKLELGEGRLFVYPAPAGSSVVTGYREGEFLVNGIIFSPSGGVESDVVGFAKADNRTVVQRIETEYFVTVLPMLSNDGVSVAFHGRKEPGDELTVGIYDMENGQSRTIPCPEKSAVTPDGPAMMKRFFLSLMAAQPITLIYRQGEKLTSSVLARGRKNW